MITPDRLKLELERLRDQLTDNPMSARIWPLGLDILANSPAIIKELCERLNKP